MMTPYEEAAVFPIIIEQNRNFINLYNICTSFNNTQQTTYHHNIYNYI